MERSGINKLEVPLCAFPNLPISSTQFVQKGSGNPPPGFSSSEFSSSNYMLTGFDPECDPGYSPMESMGRLFSLKCFDGKLEPTVSNCCDEEQSWSLDYDEILDPLWYLHDYGCDSEAIQSADTTLDKTQKRHMVPPSSGGGDRIQADASPNSKHQRGPMNASVLNPDQNSRENKQRGYSSACSNDEVDDTKKMSDSVNYNHNQSKNLISERKRRRRLNERLYSLRSLVPNISKMDKASIVGDAIRYVQELREEVEKIDADISCLQSKRNQSCDPNAVQMPTSKFIIPSQKMKQGRKILELEVSKVEDKTFHLRIYCKKEAGLLLQLSRALESVGLEVYSANIASFHDFVVNSFIVNMEEWDKTTEAEQLKKKVLDAAFKHGLQMA